MFCGWKVEVELDLSSGAELPGTWLSDFAKSDQAQALVLQIFAGSMYSLRNGGIPSSLLRVARYFRLGPADATSACKLKRQSLVWEACLRCAFL